MATVWRVDRERQQQKLLQYLKAIEKVLRMRHEWTPELARLILAAAIQRNNPEKDLTTILGDVVEYGFNLAHLDDDAKEHVANVEYAMAQGRNYRAKLTTQHLIEPAVRPLLPPVLGRQCVHPPLARPD
jgi:hypothetical protein